MSASASPARALAGAALLAALGGCDQILAIPERTLDPNLACSSGACACVEGFKSCDSDDANGCETSLDDDPAHCGACGHGCLGGACEAGRCQPVVVLQERDLGDIEIAGDHIYVTSLYDNPIRRIPLSGGEPELVANTTSGWLLRSDGVDLYWTTFTQVFSVPLDGSALPRFLAGSVSPSIELVVGGGQVYWLDFGPDSINYALFRVPSQGGPVVEVVSPDALNPPWSLAADQNRVYWSFLGGIASSPHGADAPQPLADGLGLPDALLADGVNLYWIDDGVFRIPVAGGLPFKLAPADFTGGLAIDGGFVYFTTSGGAVRRVPIAGGAPEDLALGQDIDPALGVHVAVDAQAVYWIAAEGLVRVAK